jgi:ribosomal protein L33
LPEDSELIPLEEAVYEVELAITRLALLHLSFAKILLDEFGKKKGTDLVIKSVMEYGKRIAERLSKGGNDLPKWGVYSGDVYQDNEGRYVVQGCNLAKAFREYNELDLGRLYCYVDAAKSMSSDPMKKIIHLTCEACGDDRCTFEEVPTTAEERMHFMKRDKGMRLLDPRLAQGT